VHVNASIHVVRLAHILQSVGCDKSIHPYSGWLKLAFPGILWLNLFRLKLALPGILWLNLFRPKLAFFELLRLYSPHRLTVLSAVVALACFVTVVILVFNGISANISVGKTVACPVPASAAPKA
jgi:hypothetical protein